MPTMTQYEVVKQQVASFAELQCIVKFGMQDMQRRAAPKIIIVNTNKSYRFCDPDWDVVSKQLATLYSKLKKTV